MDDLLQVISLTRGRKLHLTERMLQPASSVIWGVVSGLLEIISWISWRCEATRSGMFG